MEKWNEINFNLSESINLSEEKFELIVIQVLDLLGWKKYCGDLEIQRVFKKYNRKSKRMDILIKSKNEYLFVIEVKKPNLPITKDHINQLKDYMRFLKLDFGILFGEKIQIYYDGSILDNKDFLLIEEIEYKNNNPKGIEIVQLLEKKRFTKDALNNYIRSKLRNIRDIESSKKLKKELQTKETSYKIKKFLMNEFEGKYNKTVLDTIFKDLKISILNNTQKKEIKGVSENKQKAINKIKKREAISIINKYRKDINQPEIRIKDTIYSNKNSANNKWWFEPKPNMFKQNFNIILNDYITKQLFFFELPRNEFNNPEKYFYHRNDKNRFSITIDGNDTIFFKDELGKVIEFIKYLKYTIKYN